MTKIKGRKIKGEKIKGGAMKPESDFVTYNISEKEEDQKCAPSKIYENGSCIPLNILVAMTKGYNKMNPQDAIILKPSIETLNPGKYKDYLVMEFNKRLNDICDDQICWTKQDFVKIIDDQIRIELDKNTFRPSGPEGKFTWLNTFNINDTVSQYESKYNDFKFLGAVPIDFDELPQLGISDLDLNNLKKNGKNKIGLIFNLDEHYKPGSHWVSMFADLEKGQVYFSDSYGTEPEKRIRKFMRKVAKFIEENGNKNLDVRHNKKRHQHGNNACGVYSINFIVRLLRGESFDDINKNKIPDKEVNKCRLVYFTNNK